MIMVEARVFIVHVGPYMPYNAAENINTNILSFLPFLSLETLLLPLILNAKIPERYSRKEKKRTLRFICLKYEIITYIDTFYT